MKESLGVDMKCCIWESIFVELFFVQLEQAVFNITE